MQRWFKGKLNIRSRMLGMCFAIALPLIIIGSYFLYGQYQTLKQEASNDAKFAAFTVSRSVDLWINTQINTLNALAGFKTITTNDKAKINKLFLTALKAQSSFRNLYLIDLSGKPIQITSRNPHQDSVKDWGAVFKGNICFEQVITHKTACISNYLEDPLSSEPALMVACPVLLNKQLKYVLIASINPNQLYKLFETRDNKNNIIIDIVDNQNRVVMRSLNNDYWSGKDFSKAITVQASKDKNSGVIEAYGIADSTPRAYAFKRINNFNWLIIVGVPEINIYGNSAYLLLISLIGAIGAIALSTRISCVVTDYFTSKLALLLKETRTLGRGDLSSRVDIPSNDEFGLLAKAFNTMASKLEQNQQQQLMLNKIADSIRQSLDLKYILNTTASELGKALQASRCCIALIDQHEYETNKDNELIFEYIYYDANLGGTPLDNIILPLNDENMMKLIIEQRTILSMDVLDDDTANTLFCNVNENYKDWKSVKSLIGCNIGSRNSCLGIILVQQCNDLRQWSQSEIDLVDAVARHVSIAIQNAQLYEDAQANASQELLINHIVKSVRSSFDLNTILSKITQEIVLSQNVDRCQIAQPTADGPLVITHEYCKDEMGSAIGTNLYPNVIERNVREYSHGRPSRLNFANTKILKNYVLGIDLSIFLNNSNINESLNNVLPSNGNDLVNFNSEFNKDFEITYSKINNIDDNPHAQPFKEFLKANGTKSVLTAGLISEGKLVGLLMLHQCTKIRKWSSKELDFARSIADHIAIAITQAKLFAQVKHQAITDGMTGLYNHVYFKNRLSEELKVAQRKGTHLSIIMIDLDKLKQINDNFGHPIGDAAIRQVSSILKTILRSGDSAARYGGEEFSVILPETTLLEAALIADRLCSQIRSQLVPGLGNISASLGVACYPKQALSLEDLVDKADKALYVAKNSGRDRVCIYEESTETDMADKVEPR